MKLGTAVGFILVILSPHASHSSAWAGDVPDGERWWSHVAVLADDKLEGRNTGSLGHLKAAEYVAAEFARWTQAGWYRWLSSAGALDLQGDR